MFNYTFIIPHKNIPNLLKRCLLSIPRRDDIQIIVIDDNSDIIDDFPDIHDNDIEFIWCKESKGAGYARNLGLEKAKGKWVLFADADDYFLPNLLDKLDVHLNDDVDIIYFSVTSMYNETGEIATRHIDTKRKIEKAIKTGDQNILRYQKHEVWGKMISLNMIKNNHITFDEVSACNDTMFSVKAGHFAKKINIDNIPIYCIIARVGSVQFTRTLKSCTDRFNVRCRVNKFLYSINKYEFRMNLMGEFGAFRHFGLKKMLFIILQTIKQYSFFYFIIDLYKFVYNRISVRSVEDKRLRVVEDQKNYDKNSKF